MSGDLTLRGLTPGAVKLSDLSTEVSDAINIGSVDDSWRKEIISSGNSPPGSGTEGDRYRITAVAVGSWTGKEDNIATRVGTGDNWTFEVPSEGWVVADLNANHNWRYDGAAWGRWPSLATSSDPGLIEIATDPEVDAGLDGTRAVSPQSLGAKGDANPHHHDRPSSLPPNGAAGGDLTGTYPNPSVVAASQTVAGKVERASQAEVDAATDNIRYISPDKLPKNNYAASTDPSANSDTTVGYRVGSIWINTTDDIVWKCVDATTATAIWVPISHPIRFVKVRGDRNFKNLTYKTEDSFLWEGSDYNKYTSRKLEFIIDLNGSTDPVSVRVYNVTDITELGSLTGINTAGFKEFTFTQPVSTEALIEIQLKKDTDVSTDPIMNCSTIELERPMA